MGRTPPQRKSSRKRQHGKDPTWDASESSEQGRGHLHPETPQSPAPLVDETALPRFAEGANQHFDDVVDLSVLPADLQTRIKSKAPFVLGIKDAVYDKKFFNEVAGLCASGLHPSNITEDIMPRSKWARNWGNAVDDPSFRIWLKDAHDDIIRECYKSLYTRIYGNKPDNGGLANFWLRAATYYLEEEQPVDWATFALEVYQKRFINPHLNPQKLLPPCLTKQVQGIVDELVATITALQNQVDTKSTGGEPSNVGLESAKQKLSLAQKEQVRAINEVFRLKSIVEIELQEALTKNSKAEACHAADLETLFDNKKEAQSRGDIEYVAFAKAQITAVAQTVCDIASQKRNLEHEVDVNKAKLEVAQEELTLTGSSIRDAKCDLLDTISEVGLFPKHALFKLPKCGSLEMICPYCSRLYVENAYVPLSCGCRYHPPCMRALILSGHKNCLACGGPINGIWMAYWGFSLDKQMLAELEKFTVQSLKDDQWVEGDPTVVGGPSCFHEPETKANLSLVPYSP